MTARKTHYAYVKRAYGVNPVPGARVEETATGRKGTIIRPQADPYMVRVRFEGETKISNVHPRALTYGDAATGLILPTAEPASEDAMKTAEA